ncbi:MAG: excinuclease ABC subunit UvrA, partial [Bacteroidales bacterium]|nr:excinuclease ABC subunit UvrA [Bacteroidales bacterium]
MSSNNKFIQIKGAKVHNLKNINIDIERNKLIVITGVSGSGKSSLAFDTIYAEGQRRYVESLSSYARQFLGKINKPDVELIHGIPPAIAIEQKVNTRNPRSTVGTSTEIYDYLKLLFARIGKTISPISNKEVKQHSVTDVVNFITSFESNTKALILAPCKCDKKNLQETLEALLSEGISRIEQDSSVYKLTDLVANNKQINKSTDFNIVVDRIIVQTDEDSISRFADSVQTAFSRGNGFCSVKILSTDETSISETFSNRFEADGIEFEVPTVHTFSFNNPVGACPRCEGYGKIIGIDEDLVIPNKNLSIYEEAIACWRGEKMQEWKNKLIQNAGKFDFPIHKPFFDLTSEQKYLLWTGNKYFYGLNTFFEHLEEQKYKIQYRVMLSRYRGKTTCPDCRGTRLKKEASYIKINQKSLQDLVLLPIDELQMFFNNLKLSDYEKDVSKRILIEINNRIDFLMNVGLGYLTLNRLSSTLSGGESQRINLATSLGSSLVGSLYILDEPSIGLHSRDNDRLIKVLKQLKEIGNTVIVVEHDEDIIKSADEIIDIGPYAGRLGGEIIFQGNHQDIVKSKDSLTAKYLTLKEIIPVPEIRRSWNSFIELTGAQENNLKNIHVKFPLNIMTVVTGVSGSGKSTLIKNILSPALSKILLGTGEKTGKFDELKGDIKRLDRIEFVDQNPIGKSSRSNPVTYLKAYDEIRKLFAAQQASKINNFKPSHYSFNVEGGRCEECQGEGFIKVEMQFMADVTLQCDVCKGKRFKDEVLSVKYNSKNIYDILEMTVNESIEFFSQSTGSTEKKIINKLSPLAEVGLGYIKLGQSSSTLSGGESQRVKLASFLSKEEAKQSTLFVFDEPTTGLHFHDIRKLLDAFNALIARG